MLKSYCAFTVITPWGIVMQNSVAGIVHGGTSSDPSFALCDTTWKQPASLEPGTVLPRSPRQPRGRFASMHDPPQSRLGSWPKQSPVGESSLWQVGSSGCPHPQALLLCSSYVESWHVKTHTQMRIHTRTPRIPSIAGLSKQRRYVSLAPSSDSSASTKHPPSGRYQAQKTSQPTLRLSTSLPSCRKHRIWRRMHCSDI